MEYTKVVKIVKVTHQSLDPLKLGKQDIPESESKCQFCIFQGLCFACQD